MGFAMRTATGAEPPIFPRGVSAASKYHAAARARNEKTNEILRDFAAALEVGRRFML